MFQCRNQDFWLLSGGWWGWALILSLQPEPRVFVKLLCIFISFLSLQNRPQAQVPLPTKKKRDTRSVSAATLLSIYYAQNSIQGNKRRVYDFTSPFEKMKRSETEWQNCVLLPLTILLTYVLGTVIHQRTTLEFPVVNLNSPYNPGWSCVTVLQPHTLNIPITAAVE